MATRRLLPQFIKVRPITRVTPTAKELLGLFNSAAVKMAICRLRKGHPTRLARSNGLLRVRYVIFKITNLGQHTRRCTTLKVVLRGNLGKPANATHRNISVCFVRHLPFGNLFNAARIAIVHSRERRGSVKHEMDTAFRFNCRLLSVRL